MKVISNFLKNKEVFKDIQNTLLGNTFPYYYNDNTAGPEDKSDYFFSGVMGFQRISRFKESSYTSGLQRKLSD